MHPEAGCFNYTVREAVGVAGLISPWNLPLYLLTFKLAPALMCGNTIVAKPSELTSVTAFMLCKLFQEVGKIGTKSFIIYRHYQFNQINRQKTFKLFQKTSISH